MLRGWQLATLVLGTLATAVVALGWVYAPRALAPQGQASLGYRAAPAHFGTRAARRITGFDPESPLAASAVQVGDLIVDPPRGALLAGETVQVHVAHGNALRNLEISGTRVDWLSIRAENALGFFPGTLMLLLAILITLRKRHEVAALVLACVLFLASATIVPNFAPPGRLAALIDTCLNVGGPLTFAALGQFFLTFDGGYRGRTRSWILWALLSLGAVWIVWSAGMQVPYTFGRIWFPATALVFPLFIVSELAALLLCGLALVDRWRHAEPAARQRLRWLFASAVLGLAGAVLTPVFALLQTSTGHSTRPPLALALAQAVAFSCAALTLSYAILRYRVIDVGFVISRTFVFATLTALLLFGFGIAEWLLQHFVHFEGEKSVLLDGGVAVGVFVAVHRARDWIEHAIERVFFRAAHDKEAALQHFLDVAPLFSEPEALSEKLIAALDAYSGGRGSGIYERSESGQFVLARSTLHELPRELGPDADVVLELKTLRKTHYFARLALGSPVLTLPMIRQTQLVGFVAVTEKVDRTVYRADEIETLGRAVRDVGFDLYALRLEKVEQRGRQLEQQNEALRDGLRSLMLIARGVERSTDAQRTP